VKPVKFRPPGHISKKEAASRLGICEKTFDRRRKTEPMLSNVLLKGKELWFLEEVIQAYWDLGMKRGYL